MASNADVQEVGVSEIFEGLTAVVLAPIVLPAAAVFDQPLAKAALKEGMIFSQRCQEAVAEAREHIEDMMAEVQAELEQEQQSQTSPSTAKTPHQPGKSQMAVQVRKAMSDLDEQIGWITNNIADLRVLIPAGLGAIALRQLLVQGPQIDQIPWYTFAWYAFDSFIKLNEMEEDLEMSANLLPASSQPQQQASLSESS